MWYNIAPSKLERLVADIFKANYATCEVMHVGQPDDGGVDVVFVDSGSRRWLISVKRRLHPAKGEGVATIRNLLGAMLLKNSRYGVVVSTVDHFTYRAYEAVSKAEDMGFTLSLVDLGKLNRMLTPLLPTMEWYDIIRDHKPEWLEELCARMPNRRQCTFRDYIQQMNSYRRGIAGKLP
ncbi:MAG: restriction endonuclease [Syntrophaceae bacterium]